MSHSNQQHRSRQHVQGGPRPQDRKHSDSRHHDQPIHIRFDRDGNITTHDDPSRKRERSSERANQEQRDPGGRSGSTNRPKRLKPSEDGGSSKEMPALQIKGAASRGRFPFDGNSATDLPEIKDDVDELDCIRDSSRTDHPGPGVHPISSTEDSSTAEVVDRSLASKLRDGVVGVGGHLATLFTAKSRGSTPPQETPDPELVRARKDLKEAHLHIEDLQATNAELAADLQTTQHGLREALEELDAMRTANQRQGRCVNSEQAEKTTLSRDLAQAQSSLHEAEEENRKLRERVSDLSKERGVYNRQLKLLKKAAEGRNGATPNTSLDAFDNTVDQISESSAKTTLDSINDGLDSIVMDLLGEIAIFFAERQDRTDEYAIADVLPETSSEALNQALRWTGLSEESRGLLLDAALHHQVVMRLYDIFFESDVLTVYVEAAAILDHLFVPLRNGEPWSVSQRWRALTATYLAPTLGSLSWAETVHVLAEEMVATIASAYSVAPSLLGTCSSSFEKPLTKLFDDAFKLTLALKRDVLSVQLSVKIVPVELSFNPDVEESVWPGMGPLKGDNIIGNYGLGLERRTKGGQISSLTRPKVTTAALLRHIEIEQ
ncbi:hypothetical protein JAAARDRAFT_34722 [Jaapia argillacea MUCL 33604]|uniref:Uncharacterized protein n=1 Tax=Jaapia argillacea MUCL 33604 TaxID=933084 RepID=A0A067Q5P5_9AGAM|nr:hypothetical protein JAAARDRAFT_34722 [Jaapia argillacea MUCL 33604]